MSYIETADFDNWAKAAQRTMLTGIYDQVKDDIIDWNTSVALPIYEGEARWTRFTVTLKAFKVMASYDAPFSDEDPQFVGVGVKNDQAEGFAAPNGDLDIEVGDTYPIGLEVLAIEYLNLLPYSSELIVRAYDQTEPIAKVIASEFASTARASLNGVTATIPYGSKASNIGMSAIDKIERLANGPKQIGSHYHLYKVRNRVFWRRKPEMTSWFKYKFVAFVEEDPGDKDAPYKEIYLTLWELNLMSDETITGLEREGRRGVKRDDRPRPAEKPSEKPPG